MKKNNETNFRDNSIYTLAQSGTTSPILLTGSGTDLTNQKVIQNRAKRKLITNTTILQLINIAKSKDAKDRLKAYWNTFHCQERVYSSNGRLYGKYCKNRFCTICCGIRKAELINKYLPFIRTWEEPYFATLTVKSVKAKKLKGVIRSMIKGLKKIIIKHNKRNQRGKGIKLMGLKTLECNFNPKSKTYNPHFHLIVPNKAVINILIDEWLITSKSGWTHKNAQHKRKVWDEEKDLIEVIKYGSKTFTEPSCEEKPGKKRRYNIYASALDNIYASMKGTRIFERFGFNLPKRQPANDKSRVVNVYESWNYDCKTGDWINQQDQPLTGYNPPLELRELLEQNIDLELE